MQTCPKRGVMRKELYMKRKSLYVSVAAALMVAGATTALARDYYVVQPVATEGVVVQERVVTTPAQPVVRGTPMTMSYTVDDAFPFPSPETRVEQTGVFVPTVPVETRAVAVPVETRAIAIETDRRWPDRRNPNSD
jgi:hypothetical protein